MLDAPRGWWIALALLGPATASASPTGSLFAGPARANGASGYYNPGALADVRGHYAAMLETGLLTGDVSYARAGNSPFDRSSFDPVGFSIAAPTLDFSFVVPTPWDVLSWGLVGFNPSAASASWPDDGPQAQHGTSALFIAYALTTGPIIQGENFGFSAMVGPMYTKAGLRYAMDFGAYANDTAGAALFPLEDPSLTGFVEAKTEGWALAATFGAWYRPAQWLRFGAGFVWTENPYLEGDLVVETPPAFDETFPNQRFQIDSRVGIQYKLPWIFNLEGEVSLGDFSLAVLFQYQNKSVRDVNRFSLTETDPDVLDAVVVSVTNGEDDWMVGARLGYRISPSLELGVRFDVDPLSVPKETLHPTNLDFTSYEMAVGAQWQIDDRFMIKGTYAYLYIPDVVVTNSIYSPTAPESSGFAASSANGTYEVSAMKFLLALEARIGS